MKHKPIPKRVRQLVFDKYGGHCTYCGCELEYKDMQVDHIQSLYVTSIAHKWVDDPNVTQNDDINNLMPSCRQCNYYKAEADIEGFRHKIRETLEKTCRNSFQVQLAIKHGILEYQPWDGLFYFEKLKDNGEEN